jgi:hypothetical protein
MKRAIPAISQSHEKYALPLSVDIDEKFEKAASPYQNQRVLLRARIDDACFPPHMCTDQAPVLFPIEIHPTKKAS